MNEPVILHVETSAQLCSVALSRGNRMVDQLQHSGDGYVHAEMLHPLVHRLLDQQSVSFNQLQAVAISAGPGSYTGLRIGLSAAKGWCAALSIPLIPVNTLQMVLDSSKEQFPDYSTYVAVVDARRQDVFLQSMDAEENRTNVRFVTLHEAFFSKVSGSILVAGDGAIKIPPQHNLELKPTLVPSADKMLRQALLAWENGAFADLAYFEPLYHKEFVTGPVEGFSRGELDYL